MTNFQLAGLPNRWTRGRLCVPLVILVPLVFLFAVAMTAKPAYAGEALPSIGDLNRDGATDILDVQASIGQVLGSIAHSPEADVDENASVDVLDVQHLINTALEVGGLVQRVRGVVRCDCELGRLRVVAISRDGRRAGTAVDPNTGAFELVLRTRTSWALGLCAVAVEGDAFRCLGIFEFPLGAVATRSLPLIDLARGEFLDLGVVTVAEGRLLVSTDLLRLLSLLGRQFSPADGNENGVPDFVEPLLRRIGGLEDLGLDVDAVLRLVGECLGTRANATSLPNLSDTNGNRIPDLIEDPYLVCLRAALEAALPNLSDDVRGRVINRVIAHVVLGIPEWLRGLDIPILRDVNENGIPDQIEEHLILLAGEANRIDTDGNFVPDFLDDHDGDGIPNIEDPDWRARTDVADIDGDGIPDLVDVDDDNDGVPDYADNETRVDDPMAVDRVER